MTGPRFALALAAALFATSLPGAQAQDYPSRPVKVIVPFGAGGPADVTARQIGNILQESFGQPFVIENRTGAGGVIGTQEVAKSPPDGYTLLVGATGAMTISPAVYSKLPYVTLRDFVPLSMIASFPLLVTVNAGAPVKDIQELVA
jgi:tripartite-type tricarboxylate transporter receptor subunit TctC